MRRRGAQPRGGGGGAAAQEIGGSQKPIEAGDVAAMMAFAERVVIVPGYGLAVAQAQHKIWELAQRLMERGVKVSPSRVLMLWEVSSPMLLSA